MELQPVKVMPAAELVRMHVSDDHFASAIGIVRVVGRRVFGNAARRDDAVQLLTTELHVPENLARLLVELAVLFVKTSDQAAATE